MRITPKERCMAQQYGLGISLVLLLVHNILFGFDFVSETVLTLGTIFFILLFKRNKKMKSARFKKEDLVVWFDLLGRITQVESFERNGHTRYRYCLGDNAVWVEEEQLRKADWRDETRILKRK